MGHRVFTPTQTGLGERRHLLAPTITLDTFIADLVNAIEAEELDDVVLVGHSFAGIVISGCADRMPERVRHLVYLDSVILQDGQCLPDGLPPDMATQRRRLIAEHEVGGIPPPDPSMFGVPPGPDHDWVRRRLTPQPAHTHDTPLRLRNRSATACPAPTSPAPTPRWPASHPPIGGCATGRAGLGWRSPPGTTPW